jgi:pimeloyl-ACP methyl ester carboxylesterase
MSSTRRRTVRLLAVLAWVFGASVLEAQARETAAATLIEHRLIGLYELPDATPLFIWSSDGTRLVFAFGDGEIRGLAREGDGWIYGASLGVTSPPQGGLRFELPANGPATAVAWTVNGSAPRTARRVALRERETTFVSKGATLAGTIIAPAGAMRGGIVFLHGSGAETRDGSRVFAYLMAQHGIASLIFDKRGTGRSGGRFASASFAELATDALGAMAALRREPGMRSVPVGLFGPSQGAWIALEATRMAPDIGFLVLQSGDATSPLEQEMHRGAELLRRGTKLNEEEIRAAVNFRRQKFLYAITGDGKREYERALEGARREAWFANIGDKLPDTEFWKPNGLYDPMPALTAYRGPVLAVFGARDGSKDVERNAQLMRDAFARAANTRASVVVMPNANHAIFETFTGLPLERELPALHRIAPEYLSLLTDWVGRVTEPAVSRR